MDLDISVRSPSDLLRPTLPRRPTLFDQRWSRYMIPDTHGNAKISSIPGGRSPVTARKASNMPWKLSTETSPEAKNRPPLTSQQSNSLPSTPYQHARKISFHSRSPSPPQGNTSPRSTHSESTHLPPSLRKQFSGCKYETAW